MSEHDDGSTNTSSGSHNQSVLRAIAVLRCFVDQDGGRTLSDLARSTGISVSATHRILQTMVAGGVLRRDDRSDRYEPGIVLLALAGVTYDHAGFGPYERVLRELADRTGESASLAFRDETCAVVVLSVEGRQQLRFSQRTGSRIPLHGSPLGLALLAASEESSSDAVRSLLPLTPFSVDVDIDPDDLARRIDDVREAGFAAGDELAWPGARTVAVAVPGDADQDLIVLGVHGPADRLDDDTVTEVASLLRSVTAQFTGVPTQR